MLVDGLLVLDPIPSAVILEFVEGSGDGVEKTIKSLVSGIERNAIDSTYVLMIARMKVPQGRLQESSLAFAVSPVTVLGLEPLARRFGL